MPAPRHKKEKVIRSSGRRQSWDSKKLRFALARYRGVQVGSMLNISEGVAKVSVRILAYALWAM